MAAKTLRHPLLFVTIVPEAGTGGLTQLGRAPPHVGTFQHRFESGVIILSGMVAQRQFAPRSAARQHSNSDLEALERDSTAMFFSVDGRAPSRRRQNLFYRLLLKEAQKLVRDHWLEVHRVAQTLLTHKAISDFLLHEVCSLAADEWNQVSRYEPGLTGTEYVCRERPRRRSSARKGTE